MRHNRPLRAARRRSRPRGFLLLEALIAIAILSLGIASLFSAYGWSLRSIETSRDHLRAAYLLEEKIWELERAGAAPPSGAAEDPDLGPVAWTASNSSEAEAWTRWDLTLSWGRGERKRELSASACLPAS
jgi:Tfp pilus assembly protein PilV